MSTGGSRIPLLDLKPQIHAHWGEIQRALRRVLRTGRFILGREVAAFESEVAQFLGVRHAIGCNSGTDALVLSLRALEIGSGDEVITTPFTFFATVEAIHNAGATPVLVDIDADTLNIDPSRIEAAVTERTKAIVPVHLFGHAADMNPILQIANQHDLRVIEDAAQAFGGKYRGRNLGSLGEVSAFSLFPSKNLGAFGDAGLVVTNNDSLAEKTRLLRTHGAQGRYHNEMLGYNSRLDELQAAILRIHLQQVSAWNDRRRRTALAYNDGLDGVPWIRTPHTADYGEHAYHQYTVRIVGRDRDQVAKQLDAAGIDTAVYYPVPIHQLPVYTDQAFGSFPVAEAAANEVLSLPMGQHMTDAMVRRVVGVVKNLGTRAIEIAA